MTSPSTPADPMLQHIFDALPAMIFVVDTDLRVQAFNAAAAEVSAVKEGAFFKKSGGEVLGCLNAAASPGGCGHDPACAQCVIRNSVGEVFKGNRVVRRRTRLELSIGGKRVELFALVTASPLVYQGQNLALLVIEDFSEIAELRRMIPICCVCKKIRDDLPDDDASTAESGGWSRLEAYFKSQWGVNFSHGYCPDCYREVCGHLDAVLTKRRVT
jgi:hypothetical protein